MPSHCPRSLLLLEKMRQEWDERARENARHYIATAKRSGTMRNIFESGRQNVSHEILTDMGNVCQGKDPEADEGARNRLRIRPDYPRAGRGFRRGLCASTSAAR